MTWLYKGSVFEHPAEQYYGFVYQISNTVNTKKYIGKKLFWFKKTKTVKGKKKRFLAPSDWQDYYGSSKQLLADVDQFGKEKFVREIITLCRSKGECSYYEAKAQFDHSVLFNPDVWYNDWIICRVHRRHLNDKAQKDCGSVTYNPLQSN